MTIDGKNCQKALIHRKDQCVHKNCHSKAEILPQSRVEVQQGWGGAVRAAQQ